MKELKTHSKALLIFCINMIITVGLIILTKNLLLMVKPYMQNLCRNSYDLYIFIVFLISMVLMVAILYYIYFSAVVFSELMRRWK